MGRSRDTTVGRAPRAARSLLAFLLGTGILSALGVASEVLAPQVVRAGGTTAWNTNPSCTGWAYATIPSGTSAAQFTLVGGGGGAGAASEYNGTGYAGDAAGGSGASIVGLLNLSATGKTYVDVYLGCGGTGGQESDSAGSSVGSAGGGSGYASGGGGGPANSCGWPCYGGPSGGGGGGAASVLCASNAAGACETLLVESGAGGGGGGQWNCNGTSTPGGGGTGESGGTSGTTNGTAGQNGEGSNNGGGGGTGASGGTGGSGSQAAGASGATNNGGSGSSGGAGGNGNAGNSTGGGGGGGGGGYNGGGGGGGDYCFSGLDAAAGGGGGSSYINGAYASSVTDGSASNGGAASFQSNKSAASGGSGSVSLNLGAIGETWPAEVCGNGWPNWMYAPTGSTSISTGHIYGAGGGGGDQGGATGGNGGSGANVSVQVPVTPSSTVSGGTQSYLLGDAGCQGHGDTNGNGGTGYAQGGNTAVQGGGGGGASAECLGSSTSSCGTLLLVAGGGGGGGSGAYQCCTSNNGGGGGSAATGNTQAGAGGGNGGGGDSGHNGGGGGSGSTGGGAGTSARHSADATSGAGGNTGSGGGASGSFHTAGAYSGGSSDDGGGGGGAGNAHRGCHNGCDYSGGGGGGYSGGGSGGAGMNVDPNGHCCFNYYWDGAGGGGAGSSFVNASATSSSFTSLGGATSTSCADGESLASAVSAGIEGYGASNSLNGYGGCPGYLGTSVTFQGEVPGTPTISAGSATFTVGSAGSVTFAPTNESGQGSYGIGFNCGSYCSGTARGSNAWTETGSLPAGLTFNNSGTGNATITGTPSSGAGGVYTLYLYVSNDYGPSATETVTLTIDQAPAFAGSSPTSLTVQAGVATGANITFASGTYPSPTVSDVAFSGCTPSMLPLGIQVGSNGAINAGSSTTAAGTYTVCINASNGVGSASQESFTITVNYDQTSYAVAADQSASGDFFGAAYTGSNIIAVGDDSTNTWGEISYESSVTGANWHKVQTFSSTVGPLYAVSCASSTDCIAVGYNSSFNGAAIAYSASPTTATWASQTVPSSPSAIQFLTSVDCPTTTYCIAVGQSGTGPSSTGVIITSTNGGTSWTENTISGNGSVAVNGLYGVTCVPGSTTQCWADGQATSSGSSVGVLIFGGSGSLTWTFDTTAASILSGLTCTSTPICIATGRGGGGTQAYASTNPTTSSATWTQLSSSALSLSGNSYFYGAQCISTTDCFIFGWQSPGKSVALVTTNLTALPAAPTFTAVAAGLTGSNLPVTWWATVCPTISGITGCTEVGSNSASTPYPVSAYGLYGNAGTPVASASSDIDGTNTLNAVSCPSTTLCVAVDNTTNCATTTSCVYIYNGSSWSTAQSFGGGTALSVSCAPGTTFCMAVTANWAVECNNASNTAPCTAWHQTGSWNIDATHTLVQVSCASASLCAAVDNAGNAFTWNGTAWSAATNIDSTNALLSVSCTTYGTSSALCATGDGVNHCATNTHTCTFIWTSSNCPSTCSGSWSTGQDFGGGGSAVGLSCASGTSFCGFMTGQWAAECTTCTSWNNTNGYNDDPSHSDNAISCPSSTSCVIVDNNGNMYMWPNGGTFNTSSSWVSAAVDLNYSLTSVSCASIYFCMAVDAHGNAVQLPSPGR